MKLTKIVFTLIRLPRKLKARGDVSIFSLLKDSGYFETHDQISPGDIRKALAVEPECVDEWLAYSEDKRTSQGWYFERDDVAGYIVGYFDSTSGRDFQTKYTDLLEACANFIKNEVEDIRR